VASSISALLTIWRGQPDTDSMLVDLESQATVFIILDQLTEVRIGGGVGGQALFELGIVGVDLSGAVVFVEIQLGDFAFLFGDLFHKTCLSLIHFPGSRAGKSGLKFDSEGWDDVVFVPAFSIGYKAEFYIFSTFPMVWAASFCAAVVTWA